MANRTPKIPGKEAKNAQKNKEFPAEEKSKEFQKSKERKDRVVSRGRCGRKIVQLRRPAAVVAASFLRF